MSKKGFTLVELLAVIVILGVIATISAPLLIGVIGDSRESAFRSSLTGIKKAIENDYSDNGFDTNRKYYYGGYENGTGGESTRTLKVRKSNGSYEEVVMSGEINGKGMGSVSTSGSINVGIFTDEYCGLVEGNDVKVLKIDSEISKSECISKINNMQY